MCACLLLDPFQLYLEMSAVFGLSSCTAGNENVLLGIFLGVPGASRWNLNKNVVLEVIAEKMKLCYLHVKIICILSLDQFQVHVL